MLLRSAVRGVLAATGRGAGSMSPPEHPDGVGQVTVKEVCTALLAALALGFLGGCADAAGAAGDASQGDALGQGQDGPSDGRVTVEPPDGDEGTSGSSSSSSGSGSTSGADSGSGSGSAGFDGGGSEAGCAQGAMRCSGNAVLTCSSWGGWGSPGACISQA